MMYLLHNIGERRNSNYNTLEEILAVPREKVLSFDGIYKNVWQNRHALEPKIRGRGVVLFIMGEYVGKDNSFDAGMPREEYCSWLELLELVHLGALIGWHSWTHPDLTKLSDDELQREVTPPFPMRWFAYPHGVFDERVIRAVEAAGYEEAFSVFQGDDSKYQRHRRYLNW